MSAATHDDSFLEAIVARPLDDGPRLVYADWLEERGRAAEAEFLRVQTEWDAVDPDAAEYHSLAAREWALRKDVAVEWRDRLDGIDRGPRRELWEESLGDPRALDEPAGRRRARRAARNLMRRVGKNFAAIHARLQAAGYRFAWPEYAHRPPSDESIAVAADFERTGGWAFPVALAAFFREAGSINLMGAHPDWPHPAYFFDDAIDTGRHWYTDPLVVDERCLPDEFRWLLGGALGERDEASFYVGPDRRHKANVSGATGIMLAMRRRALDAVYSDGPQGFVEYLRDALQWGGFPGFKHIPDAPRSFLRELTSDLLPI